MLSLVQQPGQGLERKGEPIVPACLYRAAALRRSKCWIVAVLPVWLCAGPAVAHTGERGFVLLLPTQYYIAGGTFAVAASFLVLFFVPDSFARRIAAWRLGLTALPRLPSSLPSGIMFMLLGLLLAAGLAGSRDPLGNPLPLVVWTLWWIGLTLLQAILGDLWAVLNPWIAPYRLLRRLDGRSATADPPPLRYPAWLGYWPAVAGLLAFAWFELVDPAPDDPARLAVAVIVYSAGTLVGMLLFGERVWLARAECFSVFFGFVARLAPIRLLPPDPAAPGRRRLVLGFPGAGLAEAEPLPLSGVAFVLLTLATVSFDGLDRTFWYLGLHGINPLEFPGRTVLMAQNSLGLLAMWGALAGAYGLAVALGRRLAAGGLGLPALAGGLVLSILPISIGYHFAHYLTVFLVNAQYALNALGDPFGLGWDLLGIGRIPIVVSFLADLAAVSVIWKLQAAAVVAGHILAVCLAHFFALDRLGSGRSAILSQLPLALLMVGYTLFGLWLLATPTAG